MALRRDKIIPESDIKTIFSNLESIVEFHRVFKREIEAVVSQWGPMSEIAPIFLKYVRDILSP